MNRLINLLIYQVTQNFLCLRRDSHISENGIILNKKIYFLSIFYFSMETILHLKVMKFLCSSSHRIIFRYPLLNLMNQMQILAIFSYSWMAFQKSLSKCYNNSNSWQMSSSNLFMLIANYNKIKWISDQYCLLYAFNIIIWVWLLVDFFGLLFCVKYFVHYRCIVVLC